jgi:hypothetical protein
VSWRTSKGRDLGCRGALHVGQVGLLGLVGRERCIDVVVDLACRGQPPEQGLRVTAGEDLDGGVDLTVAELVEGDGPHLLTEGVDLGLL